MAADDTTAGGGGLLTRKLGPLPTWGWLTAITGLGLLFYLYEKRKAGTTAAATPATTATSTAASNVPDYVFQNYNVIPQTTPAPKPAPTAKPARQHVPPPSPAQPVQPPPSTTGAGSAPNVVGMTLGQATAALQAAGWSVNSVVATSNPTVGVNQQVYANSVITSAVPHTTGQAGQYFAKSVSLAVQG